MDDQSYQPQPPGEIHSLPWRPVSLTLSLGFASLTDSTVDYRDSGASFGLRLGAEIAQRLALTVGLEGTNAQRDGYNENQWAFLVGLQWFFLPQLYVRGAVGAGGVSTDDDDGLHVALGGGLGFELVQMADFALGVELAGTWLHLPKPTGIRWRQPSRELLLTRRGAQSSRIAGSLWYRLSCDLLLQGVQGVLAGEHRLALLV